MKFLSIGMSGLFLLLLVGCTTIINNRDIPPTQTVPATDTMPPLLSKEEREAMEQELYVALLEAETSAKVVILSTQSAIYGDWNALKSSTEAEREAQYERVHSSLARLTTETWNDFIAVHGEPIVLPDTLPLDREYEVLTPTELSEIWQIGDWETFYTTYPNSGLFNLSRVGFNANQTQALVYMEQWCPGKCGEGNLYLLEKEAGGWRVIGKNLIFIA